MAGTDDIDVLEGVLDKTENLVAGVRPDQLDDPTPLPGMNVGQLVQHIVGFMQSFASAANGEPPRQGDPNEVGSTEPVKDVRTAAQRTVSGWREHGTDRKVSVRGPGMPGEMVLGMTIIEYVAHGSDLAIATGQPVPYTEHEASRALERAESSLTDDFRGPDKSFGPRVQVSDAAPTIDRFLGFMGREPAGAR